LQQQTTVLYIFAAYINTITAFIYLRLTILLKNFTGNTWLPEYIFRLKIDEDNRG
jgi:hypothetical protein